MARPRIVLFGDSITEESFRPGGWGASLADAYARKADVVLRGFDGYNTRLALFLLPHVFPPESSEAPVAVTVFFGANDAALLGRANERLHVPLEEYRDNLKKIVHHLKKCNLAILIVLITPPPIDDASRNECARSEYCDKAKQFPDRTNEATGTYAEACIQVATELGVQSINIWSKMQETDGWQKNFLRDGVHLTPEGNSVVYREVIRAFDEGSLHAEAMPYDFPHHSEINWGDPEKSFSH